MTPAKAKMKSNARSSRLLCLNLLVAMHRPKDSPGSSYGVYVEKWALFGLRQGRAGGPKVSGRGRRRVVMNKND